MSVNFIHVKENALDQETCEKFINLFESHLDLAGPGHAGDLDGNPAIQPTIKKSTDLTVDVSFLDNPTWASDVKTLLTTLNIGINEYKEKYYTINDIGSWKLDWAFNIQRYLPGEGYFAWHCENSGFSSADRILAWMINLNNVTEGGQTAFSYDYPALEPKQGNLAIWPAYWTHYHKGVVAHKESKYIITGWYVYDPNFKLG